MACFIDRHGFLLTFFLLFLIVFFFCSHAAKVKCVRSDPNDLKCQRCERLGIKCIEHVSRQGQGTRRRKKSKMKPDENTALAPTSSCAPVCQPINNLAPEPRPICPQSSSVKLVDCGATASVAGNAMQPVQRNRFNDDQGLCSGMDKLEIEDSLLCKSITNGLTKDHFGVNVLLRQWIALAFTRRSFSLLARASFIAAKMQISMDDILSNQSPFAAATDSDSMEHVARDLLLPKSERVTLGYPIDLQEIPWDLFEAVQIDPRRPEEGVSNRWITIRWTCQGISRFWCSPLFSRDFATVEECGEVYAANKDKEVIDLFFPKSEKPKFSQGIFNLLFVNHKPNMEPFVIKHEYKVNKRNIPMPITADVIQTVKIVDLDSVFFYYEIQMRDRQIMDVPFIGDKTSSMNKRELIDVDPIAEDPLTIDGIDFADIEVTDEMEEFLKLINGDSNN